MTAECKNCSETIFVASIKHGRSVGLEWKTCDRCKKTFLGYTKDEPVTPLYK